MFDSRAITIQNKETNATSFYILEGDEEYTDRYTPTITFTLQLEDLIAIKAIDTLAKNKGSTYISLSSELVTDVSPNTNPIESDQAK